MFTAFDVGVGILVLISAILAAVRGLTREVLSLATWAGSAAIAVYAALYIQKNPETLSQYIDNPTVAYIAAGIVAFIVSLIVLHLLTMWIADFVVDSRIGPIDRTLGFVFGGLRGILIAVVIVVFGTWLLPTIPTWASESKSLPVLQDIGQRIIAMLPPDLEKQVTDILQSSRGGGVTEGSVEPPADVPPDESTDIPETESVPDATQNPV